MKILYIKVYEDHQITIENEQECHKDCNFVSFFFGSALCNLFNLSLTIEKIKNSWKVFRCKKCKKIQNGNLILKEGD